MSSINGVASQIEIEARSAYMPFKIPYDDNTTNFRCQDISDTLFNAYICRRVSLNNKKKLEIHLNKCQECWIKWDHFRWNKAKNSIGYNELKEYLGSDFKEYFDSSTALATEWNRRSPQTIGEMNLFYKEVPYYLYNLVIWQESGQRPPYVKAALPLLRQLATHSIVDFGCGVGNDGLSLIELGYQVTFCDFDNAAMHFLKWRLKKRGLLAKFIEPNDLIQEGHIDTLWAIDVLEHISKPQDQLRETLNITRAFIFNIVHDDHAGGRHPFHFTHSFIYLHNMMLSNGFSKLSVNRTARQYNMYCYYR